MMILSKEETFSDSQNITATGPSTNVIDLGAPGTVLGALGPLVRDVGPGRPIQVNVSLVADAGGTTPTLDATLEVDSTEAFASAKTVAIAPQIGAGLAGDRVGLFWIPEGTDERYLRVLYTLGGTGPDYTLDASVVAADQTND